ncbi:GGDEF domain-containing protein [Catellatospora sichuanensis]|uniref:GGDEF domain-containing protein n=1 Tax=Catellatospora sichuanensis TaxID=1969805 RepID=UPI001642C8B0|nr:GGDEF domain-containing protein [Catellatospora sichuanensis]
MSTLPLLIATVVAAALLLAGRATALPALRRTRAAYEHAWHLAHVDELTGLPNRRHALPLLEQRLADREPTMVMLLDLDRFKTINDEHGHAAGDQLLQQCAVRLENATATVGGYAARLGGDEFLLILPTAAGNYANLAADILGLLERPLTLHPDLDNTIKLTPRASAGLALTGPQAWTGTALLHRADIALYQAKREEAWYWLHHDSATQTVPGRNQVRLRDLHRTPGRHHMQEGQA